MGIFLLCTFLMIILYPVGIDLYLVAVPQIADALQAAGGFTAGAFVFGTDFTRESVPFTSLPFKVMAYEAPAFQLIGCFNVSTPPTLLAVSVPNVGRPLETNPQVAPPPVDSASKPPFPAAKS